eukprot:scaffold46220_cov53-Phaeocystis_antarctica.AAC.2
MLPLCQRDVGAPLECDDPPRPSPGSKLWRHQGSTLTMLVCGVAGTRSSVAMAAAARAANAAASSSGLGRSGGSKHSSTSRNGCMPMRTRFQWSGDLVRVRVKVEVRVLGLGLGLG